MTDEEDGTRGSEGDGALGLGDKSSATPSLTHPEPPSLLVDTNCLISQVISDSKHRSPDRRTVEQLIKGLAPVRKLPTSSSCMPTEPANAARVYMRTHTHIDTHVQADLWLPGSYLLLGKR